MKASVVVCTYNRSNHLERLLNALIRQTVPLDRYELIIVDDGSQDQTASVCQRFSAKCPNISYVFIEKNGGLARARNAGIAEASADSILFIDDDCIPAADWVEKMCIALRSHSIVAGAVSGPSTPYLQLCHNIAEFHSFMPGRKSGEVQFIAGANMGFQRDVLYSLSGFRESLRIAQDMELILRARAYQYRIYFEPASLVMHYHVRKYLFQAIEYSARHAATTIVLRNRYRCLMGTPIMLRFPILLLLGSPLMALMVTMGIYLRNSQMVKFVHAAPVIFMLKMAWCWGAARGLSVRRESELENECFH